VQRFCIQGCKNKHSVGRIDETEKKKHNADKARKMNANENFHKHLKSKDD
jgi:hypothetical protein